MTDPVETILTERNTTHGSFSDNARISQDIKRVFHASPCWNGLHDAHKEALHMIAMKISRILSGHASFNDHWDDGAGYFKLGSAACHAVRLRDEAVKQRKIGAEWPGNHNLPG